MSDKLMYIYNDHSRAVRRVEIAQTLGFEVEAVSNRMYKHPDYEQSLIDSIPDLRGLWMDIPASDVGLRTRHLVWAAHEAGKRLLGEVPTDNLIPERLNTFIGLPQSASEERA